MIVDKKLKMIDKLNKCIMVWYITRFKYHIDARYYGKDVATELPVKVTIFYDSKKTPLSVKFTANMLSENDEYMTFNEAILIREPKFFHFGKFEPVIVHAMHEQTAHDTKNANLVFQITL